MPKLKWDYKTKPINYDGVDDKFIHELKSIVGFPDEHVEGVKSYMEQTFIMYQLGKANSSRHNPLFPDKSSIKAAASSILTDVNSLLKKLGNEAGGLRIYYQTHLSDDEPKSAEYLANSIISDLKIIAEYNNDKTFDLHRAISNRQGVTGKSMDGLVSELTTLKEVCESIPTKVENTKNDAISGTSPKQTIVNATAFLFRDCFDINPSIYLSKDHEKGSQYARFLSACFMELEGHIPGDLKKLMLAERGKWEASQRRHEAKIIKP